MMMLMMPLEAQQLASSRRSVRQQQAAAAAAAAAKAATEQQATAVTPGHMTRSKGLREVHWHQQQLAGISALLPTEAAAAAAEHDQEQEEQEQDDSPWLGAQQQRQQHRAVRRLKSATASSMASSSDASDASAASPSRLLAPPPATAAQPLSEYYLDQTQRSRPRNVYIPGGSSEVPLAAAAAVAGAKRSRPGANSPLQLPSKASRGPSGARKAAVEAPYLGPPTQQPLQHQLRQELPPLPHQQQGQQGHYGGHTHLLQRLMAQRTAVQEYQQQDHRLVYGGQQPAAGESAAGSFLSLYEALQQDPSSACAAAPPQHQHHHQPQHYYHQQQQASGRPQLQPSRLSASSDADRRAMPFCSAAGPAAMPQAPAAPPAAPLQTLQQQPHSSLLQGHAGLSYQLAPPAAATRLHQGLYATPLQPCRAPTAADYEAQWVAIGPEGYRGARGRITRAYCRVRERGHWRRARAPCLPAGPFISGSAGLPSTPIPAHADASPWNCRSLPTPSLLPRACRRRGSASAWRRRRQWTTSTAPAAPRWSRGWHMGWSRCPSTWRRRRGSWATRTCCPSRGSTRLRRTCARASTPAPTRSWPEHRVCDQSRQLCSVRGWMQQSTSCGTVAGTSWLLSSDDDAESAGCWSGQVVVGGVLMISCNT
jgi:hypothetical protein